MLKSLHAAHVDKHGGFLRRLFGRKRQAPHRLIDPHNAFFVVEKIEPNETQKNLLSLVSQTLRRLSLDDLDLSWVKLGGDSPPPDPPAIVSFRTEKVAEPIDITQSINGKPVAILESQSFVQGLLRLAETQPHQASFLLAQRLVLTNLSDEPSALGLAETLTSEVIHG